MFEQHTTTLPCGKCRYAVKAGELDQLDFCEDCGHFHVESECPVPVDEGTLEGGGYYHATPAAPFGMLDKDDPR